MNTHDINAYLKQLNYIPIKQRRLQSNQQLVMNCHIEKHGLYYVFPPNQSKSILTLLYILRTYDPCETSFSSFTKRIHDVKEGDWHQMTLINS